MHHTVVAEHLNDFNQVAKVRHLVVLLLPIRLVFLMLSDLLNLGLCNELEIVLVAETHRGEFKYLGFRKGVSKKGLSLEQQQQVAERDFGFEVGGVELLLEVLN